MQFRSPCARLAVVVAAALLNPAHALAQWGVEGVKATSFASSQYEPALVSDGSGGCIVVWEDTRGGAGNNDLYAQRFDATGAPLWAASGVLICDAAGHQADPRICTDAAGGAIVVWTDFRGGAASDIYAQRILAAGTVDWTLNGKLVCNAANDQEEAALVEDSFGGAIFAWVDMRNGNRDIFVARATSVGNLLWTGNGVSICTAADDQQDPVITTNGSSTATVAWRDRRSGTNYDVYARRVNPAGTPQWTGNGVAVGFAANDQDSPTILSDGSTGVLVVWRDARNGNLNRDIYAQRLDSGGIPQWGANGLAVCDDLAPQEVPLAVMDGAGGAFVAWHDYRSGASRLFAQRIDGNGAGQWTADGIAVASGGSSQFIDGLSPDGAGGVHVAFAKQNSSFDGYVQRIDGSGALQWGATGTPVALKSDTQSLFAMGRDGGNGAIVVWEDHGTPTRQVFLQRVLASGNLADVNPVIASVTDVPADQGGWVHVSMGGVIADQGASLVTWYNVWRQIPLGAGAKTAESAVERGTDGGSVHELIERSRRESVQLRPDQAEAAGFPAGSWESIGYHAAAQLPTYTFVSPTRNDATAPDVADETYLVTAHTTYPSIYGVSAPMEGYSTDNLAPGMPQNLAGQQTAPSTVHMTWSPNTESDFWHYAVYKGPDASFVPGTGNRIGVPTNPAFDDAAFDGSYYKVSAIDRHGNESLFAQLAPGQVVGVTPGTQPEARSFFGPCAPNPFATATTLRFGMREAGDVRLEVFDLTGRRVRTLVSGTRPAGEHSVSWNGRDERGALARPGLYLVRLAADDLTATRRLILSR